MGHEKQKIHLQKLATASRNRLLGKLINKKFNDWLVIGTEIDEKRKILCRCVCGLEQFVSTINLQNGASKCCGCKSAEYRHKTFHTNHQNVKNFGSLAAEATRKRSKDALTLWVSDNLNKKFGNMTVIDVAWDNRQTVLCQCECGVKKSASKYKLISGETTSCGCQKAERLKDPVMRTKAQLAIIEKFSENNERSRGEQEVCSFIESLGFATKKTYLGGSDPKEIDICVIGKSLCIEYNGDYWHSEANKIGRNYHSNKSTRCALEKKALLIHIFESEWKLKKQQFKHFLTAKLGIFEKKYRASNCIVKEISKKEAQEFLKEIHLQGAPKQISIALGLFDQDNLLSVMTFSTPHRQNMDSRLHMSRYATVPGVLVYGGLSKLSQYAFNAIGEFITYVHIRLSDGNSYKKSGYILEKVCKPDYWYYDTRKAKIVSKQSRRKSAVNTPKNMTEHEHAKADGLFRIYDSGKLKFVFKA